MAEYIEKNAAIAKLTRLEVTEPLSTMIDAKRMLADMPAADVVPVVHGKWVDNGIPESILSMCSVCGIKHGACTFNYCPNCGAKMEVPNDD